MANRFFNPTTQYFADDGTPLAGGKLYFYETGSATPADTYTTATLTPSTENTNPVTLDAAGRHGSIFLDPSITYRVILKTAAGVTIWTADPVVDPGANVAAVIAVYPGNPNGNVAGNEGTPGGVGSSMVYDSANNVMYVCTQTGTSSTAIWTAQAGGAADLGLANIFTAIPQTVRSTDAGTSPSDAFFVADWDSVSPAANDIATLLNAIGEDSAGNDQVYARMRFRILDPTSGSEDGDFILGVVTGGTLADVLVVDGAALYPWTSGTINLGRAAERFGAAHLTTIELGHASDTTIARAAAGVVTVEGNVLSRIKTGSYTGDGATSLSITGVGFTPKYVKIWRRQTVDNGDVWAWETTTDMIDDNASGGATRLKEETGTVNYDFKANAIIALGTDGFTVDDGGTDLDPNSAGVVYNYLCLG